MTCSAIGSARDANSLAAYGYRLAALTVGGASLSLSWRLTGPAVHGLRSAGGGEFSDRAGQGFGFQFEDPRR